MTPQSNPAANHPRAETAPSAEAATSAQRKQARHWLTSLHVRPTPELVDGLVPLLPLYPKKTALGY